MDLKKLQKGFNRDYDANTEARESAADDLFFYWVTQWDDQLIADIPLQYRGQFDILRKAGRQIMSDLRLNPVQPDFRPKDDTRTDDAELMDGLYRADDRSLASQYAYDYATQDAVVCGYGAWELYTKYATNQVGDLNQVIRRSFIPEANNCVFWDASAKMLDKSDANRCTILRGYSVDGYKALMAEINDYDDDDDDDDAYNHPVSFANPEDSAAQSGRQTNEIIYVASIYIRRRVKDKVLTLVDPFGEELMLRESSLEEVMDDLLDSGYTIESEKEILRYEVRKYIADGEDILNGDDGEVVAGEFIPVVPCYGERAIVDGAEHYEGIVRLAKDPQRLRNFQMSYLADIVSRSPRPKPIFNPEQLSGFEFMYDGSGADNNYPYVLQNRLNKNGDLLPVGPVAVMPEQTIPQALMVGIELTRQAVEDVANPGLPQNIADPDLSGKAVIALQNQMDKQSYIYQHNFKFAKRRDAEIYASMATIVHDAPKKMSIELPDGTRKTVEIMRLTVDSETGEPVVLNDLTNMEFDVYAEIGQSYSNQKEQTRERLVEIMDTMQEGDPLKTIARLTLFEDMDGVNTKALRDYARKQLIIQGYKEAETDEEKEMMAQLEQQPEEPSAEMLIGQAEIMKGQAAMAREQRQMQKDAVDAQNDVSNTQIKGFEAETGRMTAQVNATKAQAEIDNRAANTFNTQVDAAIKIQQGKANQLRASVNRQYQ
jgi:hypothetical protein